MEKRNKPSAFGLLAMLDKQPAAEQKNGNESIGVEQLDSGDHATENADSVSNGEVQAEENRSVPTQWNDKEVDYLTSLLRSLVSFFNLQEINETPSISKLMDGGISTEQATALISYAALLGYEPKLESIAEAAATDTPQHENENAIEAEKGGES